MKKLVSLALAVLMALICLPLCALSEEEPLTVIAFGDSITAADKWQKHVEKEQGIDIINAGVGGDTTNTAKARFKKDVLNKSPDIVLISLGVNDCAIDMARYVTLEDYKANMAYFIDECHKIGAKVIVNIPTPVVDEQYLTRHKAEPFEPYGGPNGIVSIYAEACREVAREKNVVTADLNEYFLATDDYTKYFPDGVHPSDTGYKMYGEAVSEVFERLWLGDINGDGNINQYDYILVMREYFDTYTLDEKQTKRADTNFDGTVNQYDYVLIKRHYFDTYRLLGN
ncbi:MAG: hypothetical protein J6R45_04320 [Clostridia bacterium]|nr:hypothetical protein [Clostridia bacterium]